MSGDDGHSKFPELESPLDGAVEAVLAEPLPDEAVERVTFRAKQLAARTNPRWKEGWDQGRKLMRRPLYRMIAVASACLVLAGLWMFVPGRQSTAQAFNKLAEALIAAKTARFQTEVATEGKPVQMVQCYYLAPGRFRQELANGSVVIIDLNAGKSVGVNPSKKEAVVLRFKGTPPRDETVGSRFDVLLDLLSKSRDAPDAQYQRLGEKEIDGRRAVGFRFDSPAACVTLWGDPSTGFPVQTETIWSGQPVSKVTDRNFQINLDLKESLFDTTVPAGFKVTSLGVEFARPSEEGLINAFRMSSEIGGGKFPESLDSAAITRLLGKAAEKGGKRPAEVDLQRLTKMAMTMSGGFQFALELPESADAHYAGDGFKRDTRDRPIFWYRPQGASKYRVIFADLSAKDEDNAPRVSGAKRIEKASKTANRGTK